MIIIIIIFIILFFYNNNLIFKENFAISYFKLKNKGFIFPNNKRMVYISSWDDEDNYKTMNRIILLTKKINLKLPLTIFAHTKPMTYERWVNVINNKIHSIESHSESHPDNPDNAKEYIDSQKKIKELFGKSHGLSYAYPHGLPSKKKKIINLIKKLYISARGTKIGYFKKGDNIYNLNGFPIEKVNYSNLKTAMDYNLVLITYGHGIKGISGWNPIPENKFIEHLKLLKKYESQIWFVTLSNLIKYLKKTKQI
jgi:hypothetical protein